MNLHDITLLRLQKKNQSDKNVDVKSGVKWKDFRQSIYYNEGI